MGMSDLTHSSKWKSFMNYCYSWGASVVLMGALFKLQHWTGGGTMLTIGMSTEVLIFFLSAFEPAVEIPDWKKVYRQLRPDYIPLEEEEEISYPVKQQSFDNILEKADISPELLAKVKKGLQDLSNAATGIADISSATLVTDEYVKNMSGASESMASFNDINTRATHSIEKSTTDLVHSYDQSTQILTSSSKNLAQTFSDSSKKINEQLSTTGDKLTQSYKSFSELVNKDISTLTEQTKTYSAGLSQINTSMSALNSSYELHLQNTKKLSESSAKAFEGYSKMTEVVNNSLEEAQKYRKQTELLNKNLEALNHVYGNMLGAMNVKG
jgi:gliding motility-associated protein GldL